ncbi:uncharacterized protein G2W53_003898 [Senna tora]|uniref:Uncharacterized protein n=1 Tax=Senna tora TaxID=362788 RepID=A0A834XAW3_9FABA|nr:uncharacterized protein G2W53_003898 [Senna tora]
MKDAIAEQRAKTNRQLENLRERHLANNDEVEAQRQYITELNRHLTIINGQLQAAERRIGEVIAKSMERAQKVM